MSDATTPPTFPAAQYKIFALAAALLTLGFIVPLWHLLRFAAGDDLHSYIPLMPFVSGYLVWTNRSKLPRRSAPAPKLAALFGIAGIAAAIGYVLAPHFVSLTAPENRLALVTLAWLLCLAGAGGWFLGGAMTRALAFPFCLLLFMIPFPTVVREAIESFLQSGSATMADWMFIATGTPFWRDGMVFHLPGMTFRVAPECSGIHSTLVLFITSLLAAQVLLRQPWKRATLCLAVIPLALLRNGLRVFVIGQLCIHVGPQMIDSPIHHHGGPLFFVLSLGPFFLLVYFLKKSEAKVITGRPPGNRK